MVENVVVKDMLTEEMIKAGRELTRILDQERMNVKAALWFYLPESNLWRFIIATALVEIDGPKKVYQRIQSILSQLPQHRHNIRLMDISAVESGDALVKLLRLAIQTGDNISGIRFSRNTINGQFIEDAYIYKMIK